VTGAEVAARTAPPLRRRRPLAAARTGPVENTIRSNPARKVVTAIGTGVISQESEGAQLLQSGLLRGSFIPPRWQRELRDLTRYRSQLVAEQTRVANRLHKVLEDANIKLGRWPPTFWGCRDGP